MNSPIFKIKVVFLLTLLFSFSDQISVAQSTDLHQPIVKSGTVFEEKNGLVTVEAEYFYKQSHSNIRQWYRTSKNELAKVGRDDDNQHCFGASNNAYIELLPDERVTHSDKLVIGENFTEEAGKMAVLHYKVKFTNKGRYFVWARAFCSGSEDNGLHVGLNGNWPEHGRRMQWCDGRGHWTWASKQRTKEEHCGIPHAIFLEIEEPGEHDIQFSMREDGFEFDKFILTTDINYTPIEKGPRVLLAKGELPNTFPEVEAHKHKKSYFTTISKAFDENKHIAAQEFPSVGTNFYKNGKNWLAINPKTHKKAITSKTFDFDSGKYDVVFVGVGENDGNSTFTILVNDIVIGSYQTPLTDKLFEEGKKFNGLWENIKLYKGDKITVIAKGGSDGHEWTRARWAGIIFSPLGKGKETQDAPSTYSAN
ncbi:hypothetical protein [Aestuariivivens insulae]|uniref:hypothetical protein n=1 Tax=Aestuariivivens insulae TaxID=1621988 RepID=UPI001F59ADF9|nr:hypothetical protein [Aestuariivivens insulae]